MIAQFDRAEVHGVHGIVHGVRTGWRFVATAGNPFGCVAMHGMNVFFTNKVGKETEMKC
jgi:hypothetical protein